MRKQKQTSWRGANISQQSNSFEATGGETLKAFTRHSDKNSKHNRKLAYAQREAIEKAFFERKGRIREIEAIVRKLGEKGVNKKKYLINARNASFLENEGIQRGKAEIRGEFQANRVQNERNVQSKGFDRVSDQRNRACSAFEQRKTEGGSDSKGLN